MVQSNSKMLLFILDLGFMLLELVRHRMHKAIQEEAIVDHRQLKAFAVTYFTSSCHVK